MADRKQKFGLLSYFTTQYAKYTGRKVTINKYAGQWDADALIDSYGYEECRLMVDRYLSLSSSPSWKGFARDAQKVWDGMQEEEADSKNRSLIKKRFKEWIDG